MDSFHWWSDAVRAQSDYHQAVVMLKAIDEHKQAIERLESYLAQLGMPAEQARADRKLAHQQTRLARQIQEVNETLPLDK